MRALESKNINKVTHTGVASAAAAAAARAAQQTLEPRAIYKYIL